VGVKGLQSTSLNIIVIDGQETEPRKKDRKTQRGPSRIRANTIFGGPEKDPSKTNSVEKKREKPPKRQQKRKRRSLATRENGKKKWVFSPEAGNQIEKAPIVRGPNLGVYGAISKGEGGEV